MAEIHYSENFLNQYPVVIGLHGKALVLLGPQLSYPQ